VLDLGAMANPMFKLKGPKIIAQEFEPHFPLKHAQKDMRYSHFEFVILCESLNLNIFSL
jgi:3-hydroxyisobutyrate dehydrogenase-like beta-hydroxyacid dehydrogenase